VSDQIEIEWSCRGYAEGLTQDGRFPLPGDKPHYPRDRVADIKHIRLDVTLDLDQKSLRGSVAHTFAPINDGLSSLDLDAVGLDIQAVRAGDGKSLSFSRSDGRLSIDLGGAHTAGEDQTIVVDFAGSPRRGMYFIGPDAAYPDKRVEVWTQGEDEDSRHWFPCYDYPNEMATSECHVSVREPFTAISNGELRSVTTGPEPGMRTFSWHQDVPHVAYLTSICAGEYGEIREDWDGIPITYHFPIGREDDAREVFKLTPQMMQLFSERTGVRYPHAKYSQVVVQDFIFGGMENVSATTVTDSILFDARARLDADGNGLIAHELAHQWFGDLITCRDWSHGWLNEGFATFFETVWVEHHESAEEFAYHLVGEMDGYLRETGSYRRPIVTNVYNTPIDLFDRHLYEKGGLVLHMLRRLLGEELFWKAIRRYVITNRGRNVVTPDLQRAIEEATGRNLDWFFDQWVYGAGHPALKAEYGWDDDSKTAKVSFQQTQDGDGVAKAFRLPLTIDFTSESGERQSFKVELREREQAFYFSLAAKPKLVRIDPGGSVLKTLDLQVPGEMLREQLKSDPDVFGRVAAARALATKGDKDAIAALGAAAREDSFWGVQAEAARGLGSIRSNAALDELLRSVAIEHPKARRAVMAALGEFREESAAEALDRIIRAGDASYYVEAAAAAAIGKTRSPRAFDALQVALDRDSQNNVIRASAFAGFAELKDERALPIASEWAKYGRPPLVRGAAASALAQISNVASEDKKAQAADQLIQLLDDSWFRSQISAISALQEMKEPRAIPHLERVSRSALDGRVVRVAREAAAAIRSGRDKGDEVNKLRGDVDKLVDENRALRDRLDKLESRLDNGKGKNGTTEIV
jgi:aminopeptidase N